MIDFSYEHTLIRRLAHKNKFEQSRLAKTDADVIYLLTDIGSESRRTAINFKDVRYEQSVG